jgi:hypothetical protein
MKNAFPLALTGIIFLISDIFVCSCKKGNTGAPEASAPVITSFSPSSDTIGASIVISGSNFSSIVSNNLVKFNGTSAIVSAATDNQLTAIVPLEVSAGPINVTVNGKTGTSTKSFTPIGPAITSFAPSLSGIGYPVVITGANFSGDITKDIVTINGASATVTAASDTLLTILVPGEASSGKIVVSVKGLPAISSDDIMIKKLLVTTFAGSGSVGSDDGPGNMASFHFFSGIVLDGNGNIYISDTYNNKIREITPDGVVSTYAGTGVSNNTDGQKATATFTLPSGIALGKNGNFYISEGSAHNDIREISSAGIVSTIAGSVFGSPGSSDGTGSNASFNNPLGLAVDVAGNIYVVDNGNNKIRKITPQGVVTTFAGSGVAGSDDGIGLSASFNSPIGITIDGNGSFYITEAGDNKIRKMTAAGEVTTIAGNGMQGSSDGQGTAASFLGPVGIVKDQSGNLFVTDAVNGKIRIITPGGLVGTVAGTQGVSVISADGTGSSAVFANPWGMAIDKSGTLYVLDNASNQVRKVTIQ